VQDGVPGQSAGKHFSLGEHQDRLASGFSCSRTKSTPAPAPVPRQEHAGQAANRWAAGFVISEVKVLDWQRVFYDALIYGLVLSLVLTILTAISGAFALDVFVDKYPPDIKNKYGPMSARAARLRPFIAALLFITFFVVPIIGLFALQAQVDSVPFLPALAFSGVALLTFNTFDLIILDWLFFCTIQPRAMVLPGTEGMPAYRDYRFHFVGFLKGLGFSAVGSLLIAAFWVILQWFITLFSSAS
jgi:hypothetical protein